MGPHVSQVGAALRWRGELIPLLGRYRNCPEADEHDCQSRKAARSGYFGSGPLAFGSLDGGGSFELIWDQAGFGATDRVEMRLRGSGLRADEN